MSKTAEEKAAAKAAKDAEKAAAKAAKDAEKAAAKAAKDAEKAADSADIEVGDPQALRPVDLPLVVKPAKGGEWKNEAQAQFASVLNAYAYRNPTKWAKKKDVLIAQLADLADHPEKLSLYKGGDDASISYKNKLIQQ